MYTTKYNEQLTITNTTAPYPGETEPMTVITAHDEDGDLVGSLYADTTTGQIMQVEVPEDRRREGIATALVAYADDNDIELFHSPEEHRTEEGAAWANTVLIDIIDPADAYQPA